MYDLHLSEEEFWESTPRRFHALMKRRKYEREHLDLMISQQIAATINFSMCRPEKAVRPVDFMPSQWDRKAKRRKKRKLSKKQNQSLADIFRGWAGVAPNGR